MNKSLIQPYKCKLREITPYDVSDRKPGEGSVSLIGGPEQLKTWRANRPPYYETHRKIRSRMIHAFNSNTPSLFRRVLNSILAKLT